METVVTRAAHIQGGLQWVPLVDTRKGLMGQELAGLEAKLVLRETNEVCLAGASASHLIAIHEDIGYEKYGLDSRLASKTKVVQGQALWTQGFGQHHLPTAQVGPLSGYFGHKEGLQLSFQRR